MWIVLRVQEFTVEQKGPLRIPFPVELDFGPMVGYLPVYTTLEDAKTDFPNGPFAEVREVQKAQTFGGVRCP